MSRTTFATEVDADSKSNLASPVTKDLAAFRAWSPDLTAIVQPESMHMLDHEVGSLVTLMGSGGAEPMVRLAAASAICAKLRVDGDADMRDLVADFGAISGAVDLMRQVPKDHTEDLRNLRASITHQTAEVIWFLGDDYDHCQQLIKVGGHDALIHAARERGAQNAHVAVAIFRVLCNTLYNEARNAELWHAEDVTFVLEALAWALGDPEEAARAGGGSVQDFPAEIAGVLCDIATLWLQRASGATGELVRALVMVLPRLLTRMCARKDDFVLMQHGCRLLAALSQRCQGWPNDLKEPTMAALSEIFSCCPMLSAEGAEVRTYCSMALKSLMPLPPAENPNQSLSLQEMD